MLYVRVAMAFCFKDIRIVDGAEPVDPPIAFWRDGFSCEVPGLQTCDWYEQMEAAKGVGSSAKTHASVHLESVHPDGEKVVVRSRPDRGLLVALEHGRVMMCNIKVSWVDSHDTAVQLMIELATHYLSGAAAKTKLIQNQFSTFKFVT